MSRDSPSNRYDKAIFAIGIIKKVTGEKRQGGWYPPLLGVRGLNRYDFNLCLKTGKLREGSLKSSGSLLQRAGPEVAKLRGPIVFVFVLGTRRSPFALEQRRERVGTVDFSTSISVRNAGAIPWRHL